jgi:hypothetical protein
MRVMFDVLGVSALLAMLALGRIRRGPSMYEMEGPRPARQRSSVPIARLPRAAGPPPVPATRLDSGFPASQRPGVAPGWWPPVVVMQFYCLVTGPHKGLARST